jgi:hypothetical protein
MLHGMLAHAHGIARGWKVVIGKIIKKLIPKENGT